LGLPDGRSLEVLICDVLGLSKDFVIMEAKTAGRTVTTLEQALLRLSA
jgi:hypothetical protein